MMIVTLLMLTAYLFFAVVLTVVDAREHRLPRRWVWAMAAVLGPLAPAAALAEGRSAAAVLSGGAWAVLLWGGLFLGLRLASPGSMGLGDVRLAPVLGWVVGTVSLPHALAALMAAFLLAGIWAAGLLLAHHAERSSRIAFGPWMLLGAGLALAHGLS